ncbi:MAG: conjugal transfer protein TraF [Gemmatimonadota bacterium]|nr:conjugal transfer protein TraF [Gemmatimonadota bacterium]
MSSTRMIVLTTLVFGGVASAQQPNASAAAFGMGGNFQAAATGFNAVAWNPAMLGVGDGGFTLNLLSGGMLTGLGPVKLADITDFGGKTIPASTKEAWLNQIGNGTETGGANAGLSIIALSVGPVAFQLGASGTGDASLNQDATEVLLYGNAGRTGAVRDMFFNGSSLNGSSFATGAVSFALPLPLAPMGGALERFSAGVTAKYVRGIAVARARDNGSSLTANNIGVVFPVIVTDSDHVGNAGSGFGMDLGVAWNSGPTTIGATLRNVVNTFQWSTTSLISRPGTVTFDGTNDSTNFKTAPYADAPASMRAALEDEKFKPEFAAGIAHRGGNYTLTADASSRIGEGIDVGPKTHLGVGAEYRALSFLALRAGVAAVTGGSQIAGGLGLKLGAAEVGFGMSARSMNNNTQYGAMFSLLSIH